METLLTILILQAIVSGSLSSSLANNKGFSPVEWFGIGLLLGVFGLIAAAGLPNRKVPPAVLPIQKKCPDCAGFVPVEARVCRHCHRGFDDDALRETFLPLLRSDSLKVRGEALDVMAQSRIAGLVDEVIALIEQPDSLDHDLQEKACNYLIAIRQPETSRALLSIIRKSTCISKDKFFRIIKAIRELRDPSCLSDLVDALRIEPIRRQELYRELVTDSIISFDDAAIPYLQELADSDYKSEREVAQKALHAIIF